MTFFKLETQDIININDAFVFGVGFTLMTSFFMYGWSFLSDEYHQIRGANKKKIPWMPVILCCMFAGIPMYLSFLEDTNLVRDAIRNNKKLPVFSDGPNTYYIDGKLIQYSFKPFEQIIENNKIITLPSRFVGKIIKNNGIIRIPSRLFGDYIIRE